MLNRRGESHQLRLQCLGVVRREQVRVLCRGIVLTAFGREGNLCGNGVRVGLAREGDDRINHQAVLVPQPKRPGELRRVVSRVGKLPKIPIEMADRVLQIRKRLVG